MARLVNGKKATNPKSGVPTPSPKKSKTSRPVSGGSAAAPQKQKDSATKTKSKPVKRELDTIERMVLDYFNVLKTHDRAFAAKWQDGKGKKDIHAVVDYLYELHRPGTRKSGDRVGTNNDDDNAIAAQFVMDDSLTVKPAPKNAKPRTKPSEDEDLDNEPITDDNDGGDSSPSPSPKKKSPKKSASKPSAPKSDPDDFGDLFKGFNLF